MLRIKDISRVIGSGMTPSRKNPMYWQSKDIPWLKSDQLGAFSVKDTTEYISKYALENTSIRLWNPGTISVAMYGEGQTRGKVSILSTSMATNQAICNIEVDESKANNYFVYYWLKANYSALRGLSSGVRNNLNTNDIKNFPFPNISIEKQKAIADFLRNIDELILSNDEIIQLLENFIQQIYSYWFLQFNFPDANDSPYLCSGGQLTWSEEINSNLPIGWGIGSFSENPLFSVISPGVNAFMTKRYLSTADVDDNKIQLGTFIDFDSRESRANMQPQKHSVWFARMKNSRKHIFVSDYSEDLLNGTIFSTGFCGLKCTEESFEYVYAAIRSPWFETVKDLNSNGATQQAITNTDLNNLKIVIPEKRILTMFHDTVAEYLRQISILSSGNDKLKLFHNWALLQLLNQKIILQ